jgi:hypothetical protein
MKGTTQRTKLLASVTLGVAGLMLGAFAWNGIVRRPLRVIDDQITQLRVKLNSLQKERQAYLVADGQVSAAAARMFGPARDEAEAAMGAVLTGEIVRVGLREADFTRIPAGRRHFPGGAEVGWTVQGEGTMRKALDLLYVLQSDPRLHRIDSLSLSPASESGRLRVRFRYLTFVLNPAPENKSPVSLAEVDLDSPARRRYDAINGRDLFRPYTAEEVAVSPPPPADPAEQARREAQSLKVVSLSSWAGEPEVHLYDSRDQRTFCRHPGEALLEGQVVCIDYRPLPVPSQPDLLSYSRLIWRIGDEFWAVEIGQTLADRRQLTPEELPPELDLKTVAP